MMNAWETLCPGCFAEKGPVAVCPYCGYDESERRTPLLLPHRTVLNGQFIVGKVLGKPGGFGITYLGWDINLATPVAVKEYLPRDYADATRIMLLSWRIRGKTPVCFASGWSSFCRRPGH